MLFNRKRVTALRAIYWLDLHCPKAVTLARLIGKGLSSLFEIDEQEITQTLTREKVAEIVADLMTTFYYIQIGALETQVFRTPLVLF